MSPSWILLDYYTLSSPQHPTPLFIALKDGHINERYDFHFYCFRGMDIVCIFVTKNQICVKSAYAIKLVKNNVK